MGENATVEALLKALDVHRPGERAHASRVAIYSVATAFELGLRNENLLLIRYAAELHDVGKVRVDSALLGKLGELTEDEIRALRLHAWFAEQVLAEFDFLALSLPMIRHHHERFDGHGYPDQLRGEAIPLGARIVGVAEAFDCMTMAGGWKQELSEERAIEELHRESGKQFDPAVVKAFLKVQAIIQPVGL